MTVSFNWNVLSFYCCITGCFFPITFHLHCQIWTFWSCCFHSQQPTLTLHMSKMRLIHSLPWLTHGCLSCTVPLVTSQGLSFLKFYFVETKLLHSLLIALYPVYFVNYGFYILCFILRLFSKSRQLKSKLLVKLSSNHT